MMKGTDLFHNILQKDLQDKEFDKAINFCDIFKTLTDLFRKLGVLDEGNSDERHDISFRFSYPDFEYKNEYENLVLFDILERTVTVSEGMYTSGTKQVKPILLRSQKDIVSGQIIDTEMRLYDNIVAFKVYSTSVQRLYQLVSYIETVLIKHKGYLHKHLVYAPQYLGMSATEFAENHYKNRMFSKTLTFKLTTAEISLLAHEELQIIERKLL